MLRTVWKQIGILTGYALFGLIAVLPIAIGLVIA